MWRPAPLFQLPPHSSHLAAHHCPTHETVLRSAFYSIFGAHSVCLVYLVIVTNFAAGCPCDELEPGGGSTSHWYHLLIMLIMAMMFMIMVMVIMIMIFMLKICFEEQLGRLSSAVWVGQTTPSLQSSRHSHHSHHSHNHHPCLGTTEFYHNSYHHCNVIITTFIIMVLLTRRHYWTSQCTTLWSDRLTSLTLPWTTSGHNFFVSHKRWKDDTGLISRINWSRNND